MSKEKLTVLKSGDLWVEINDFGGELSRIMDRKTGREILWNADPAVWNRHAPILSLLFHLWENVMKRHIPIEERHILCRLSMVLQEIWNFRS